MKRLIASIFLCCLLLMVSGSAFGQITTKDPKANVEAKASIQGFTSICIVEIDQSRACTEVPALLGKGETICGLAQGMKGARKIKTAEFKAKSISYDVTAVSDASDITTLKFSGEIVLRLQMDQTGRPSGFTCDSLFYPGIQWNLVSPIKKSASEDGETYAVNLQSGKYKIVEGVKFEPIR